MFFCLRQVEEDLGPDVIPPAEPHMVPELLDIVKPWAVGMIHSFAVACELKYGYGPAYWDRFAADETHHVERHTSYARYTEPWLTSSAPLRYLRGRTNRCTIHVKRAHR